MPTLVAFAGIAERARGREPSPTRDWLTSGWAGLLPTVADAHEAGVTVLAGTDGLPFGRIADEVGWLVKAGLPPEAALGAASWTARSWLGPAGLTDDAPADLVIYDEDPTVTPGVLDQPKRIILRGRMVR